MVIDSQRLSNKVLPGYLGGALMIEVQFFDDRPPLAIYAAGPQVAPPEFARPYDGELVIEFGTSEQVAKRCGHPFAMACVLIMPNFKGDRCYIVLPLVGPGGVSAATQKFLKEKHEEPHCNGWPADHRL